MTAKRSRGRPFKELTDPDAAARAVVAYWKATAPLDTALRRADEVRARVRPDRAAAVRAMIAAGMTHSAAADACGITRVTLYKLIQD